jgi:hypothetical protein
MLSLCFPLPWFSILASGLVLLIVFFILTRNNPRRQATKIDGNEWLMIQLTILGVFAILTFIAFVFIWKPC